MQGQVLSIEMINSLVQWVTLGLVLKVSFQLGRYSQRLDSSEDTSRDHEARIRELEKVQIR